MAALPQSMLWASRSRYHETVSPHERLRQKQETLASVDQKLGRLMHKQKLSDDQAKSFQKNLAMHNLLVRQIVQLKKETGHA